MIAIFIVFFIYSTLAGSSKMINQLHENIASGNIESLKSLINAHSDFLRNPSLKNYKEEGFRFAVKQRQTDIVDLFLKVAHFNAASNNNEAVIVASVNGYTDIVKLLLVRPEVNPGANDNEAIIMAAKNGHTEVVRQLLANEKVNAGAKDNEALIMAAKKGHTEVVRQLLANQKVDPSARQSHALFWASQNNHPDIVKLLLDDERVNFLSYVYFHILRRAAYFGNVDLVRFILNHPSTIHHRRSSSSDHIFLNLADAGDLNSIKTLIDGGLELELGLLETSLQNAIVQGHDDLIKYLKTLTAKPNFPVQPLITITEQCAICLADDSLFDGYMTACQHQFHAECLEKWIAKQHSCPICRSTAI